MENTPMVRTAGDMTLENYCDALNEKLRFAEVIRTSGMCPAHFKTREAIVTAVLYGRELGFSPMRSLSMIKVINGIPTVDAAGLKALAVSSGAIIKTLEWTEQTCKLSCSRGAWVEEFEFSMKDAIRQGLADKDNWKRMPRQMLYARCVSTLLRNMYADVIGGFYSKEEMEDTQPTIPSAIKQAPMAAVVAQVVNDAVEAEAAHQAAEGEQVEEQVYTYDAVAIKEKVEEAERRQVWAIAKAQLGGRIEGSYIVTSKPIPGWECFKVVAETAAEGQGESAPDADNDTETEAAPAPKKRGRPAKVVTE